MNVQQVYAFLGGDYGAIYEALRSDALIARLLGLLSRDKSMPDLEAGIESADPEAAFRAAHTLKGVALNLHLGPLAEKASALTEILRPRKLVGYEDAYETLKREFARVQEAIAQLE